MHARHRGPGNGYRSGSVGMGSVAAASRIAPENSVRGHGFYNSEYRGYTRGGGGGGFGRGQSKHFQPLPPPPPPPPRKGDIFMEAGRLATEYLVSKGLLPPNVLSGKWQNGGLKNQVGEFQGFRAQVGDNLHLHPEGRASALSRLGNCLPDVGSSRRRFPDEYAPGGSRNYMRDRKRLGSFKNRGSEWNREFGRSGSWSGRSRTPHDLEGNDDVVSGNREELHDDDKDGNELATKGDGLADSESILEKKEQTSDDAGSKQSDVKDVSLEAENEPTEKHDDLKNPDSDAGEVNDQSSVNVEKQSGGQENDSTNKNGSHLLRLCNFAKVPTKTRSSLATRGSKADPVSISEDDDNALPVESGDHVNDISPDGSSGVAPSKQSSEFVESDVSNKAGEGEGEVSHTYASDRPFMDEQETKEEVLGFGSSTAMVMERGEKRPAQDHDISDGNKKPRDCASPMDIHDGEPLLLSNLREKQQIEQEGRSLAGEEMNFSANQNMFLDISLFPKSDVQPRIEYAEEKELLPSSFKICDLNLMEASDVHENHDTDTILNFPSNPERGKEVPAGIDLSMSNTTDKYGNRGSDGKEVVVIDLENDSFQEDNAFHNTERTAEAVFTGLDSFHNHSQNVGDIHDVLMISELLGNDIPSCSSVPTDIHPLHNDMGLHNGEGILGDDDSIYMSLGEIPISFLPVWEQQSPEYDKHF